MKTTSLLLSLLLVASAQADFETWTNQDGQSVELDPISKSETNGELTGTFRMRNGRTVNFPASKLSADSAEKLKTWQPAASPEMAASAATSAYDDILDGNLEILDGKRLKRLKEFAAPQKKYVFYYTASWCAPCQKFTPQLVEFYNENKNKDFEIILITSDSDEDAMAEYATNKKMPWPHLKLRKVDDFKKDFPNKLKGIPYLAVTNLQGEILTEGNAYSILPTLKEHLAD